MVEGTVRIADVSETLTKFMLPRRYASSGTAWVTRGQSRRLRSVWTAYEGDNSLTFLLRSPIAPIHPLPTNLTLDPQLHPKT
jgi:hypothetical protein